MDTRIQVVVPSLTALTMGLLLAGDSEGWLKIVYLVVLAAALVWINVLHFRTGRSPEVNGQEASEAVTSRRAV